MYMALLNATLKIYLLIPEGLHFLVHLKFAECISYTQHFELQKNLKKCLQRPTPQSKEQYTQSYQDTDPCTSKTFWQLKLLRQINQDQEDRPENHLSLKNKIFYSDRFPENFS